LRLRQLDAMDAIDALQARVDAFRRDRPGEQVTWQKLLAARLLSSVPVDPSGVPFVIDAGGRVTVARESSLFPLPGQKPDAPS
jgi:hypothetical protein